MKKLLLFRTILISQILLSCGLENTSELSIVGGNEISDSSPARYTTVGLSTFVVATCTASLITPDILMTAAHCVDDFGQGLFQQTRVYFNTRFNSGSKTVERYVVHPLYKNADDSVRVEHDIALVKLEEPAPEPYKPLPLLFSNTLKKGMEVIQAGFGASGTFLAIPTGIGTLREVKSKITRVDSRGTISVKDNSGKVRAACIGDSGGPLIVKVDGTWHNAGVTSRANRDFTTCNGGNRYAALSKNKEFIEDTIELLTN